MDPDQIAVVEPVSGSGSAQWADLMVRTAPEDRWLALGASFSLLREPIATRVIGKVALQNGAIATLGFTPGADIAVLTANQVRMVLEIAGLYGEELSAERAKEILATIGGAFLLRAAARQMLGLIPIAGWAVKGAVGYLGTVAIGRAALVYFANPEARERLTDKLSTLAERAQTAFRPESDVQASDNEVLPVVQNL